MAVKHVKQDHVSVISIDRIERRNAVDTQTAQELLDCFEDFAADDRQYVAILTGTGEHFCAGADLQALAAGDRRQLIEAGNLGPMGPTRLQLEKPVIAAIEGYAVAGGLELALWCDLRVAGEDAKFGIFCRRFGVPLIDLGTIRLPRLIGHSRAMDMVLTGREMDAKEAYDIGLVNRLVATGSALQCARELAAQLCMHPQVCMRNDRLSLMQQWGMSEQEAMQNEMCKGLASIHSGETLAGAASFSSGTGRHGKPLSHNTDQET